MLSLYPSVTNALHQARISFICVIWNQLFLFVTIKHSIRESPNLAGFLEKIVSSVSSDHMCVRTYVRAMAFQTRRSDLLCPRVICKHHIKNSNPA